MNPLIRLEIGEMKHTILAHLNTYQKQVSDAVKDEIEKVVIDFDFGSAVKDSVQEVLKETIESYFKYGNGYQMIQEAIQDALNNAFKK